MNIDRDKLLKWLENYEKSNIKLPHSDYKNGMEKVIDDLAYDIEEGDLDVKEGSHD